MKDSFKKIVSLIVAVAIVFTFATVSASALSIDDLLNKNNSSSDPTGFGVKDMSYGTARVAIPLMNKVFDAVNLLAGTKESWSSSDGMIYEDLNYTDKDGNTRDALKYDLYIPEGLDVNEAQGLILFIHGGTWTMGSKDHCDWSAACFAKQGFITATMDYDLASQGNDNVARVTGSKSNADIFDMLDDVTSCTNAIIEKCSELGYTLDRMAMSGFSSGSHLLSLYAYSRADECPLPIKMIFPITTPVGFYKGTFDNYTNAEVASFATIVSGETITAEDIENPVATGKDTLLKAISPVANINENSCPTLMGFAGKDKTIGNNQYNTIKAVLDEYGIDNEVFWWKNSDHTLLADPGTYKKWTEKVNEWLEFYMASDLTYVETEEKKDNTVSDSTVISKDSIPLSDNVSNEDATSEKIVKTGERGVTVSVVTALATSLFSVGICLKKSKKVSE